MTHQWNATIQVPSELAKQLIESQLNLQVESIRFFGEGFDNIVYLINDAIIFRFPRREMGIDLINNEIKVLPYIAKHVSFRFSYPQFIGQPTKEYPYAFAGYPIIQGPALNHFWPDKIDLTQVASELGTWLRELHQIAPLKSHRELFGDRQLWRVHLPSRQERCLAMLSQYGSYFEQSGFDINSLKQILKHFTALQFTVDKSCYLHGDIYCKHVIIDDELHLRGLIDWGDCHIGHPGIDVSSAIMLFDENTRDSFFAGYGEIDDATHIIATLRAFCHPFALLPYAYEQKDEKVAAWATVALLRGKAALEQIYAQPE